MKLLVSLVRLANFFRHTGIFIPGDRLVNDGDHHQPREIALLRYADALRNAFTWPKSFLASELPIRKVIREDE